jgi:hypothetical protein
MTATTAETPHVRLPVEIQDLVGAGKLSIHAGWLYGLLLAHINYGRGDALVWPSRGFLAKRMGLSKTQSVDRYLKELADAGLIECERRKSDKRGNESNRYTLLMVSWPKKTSDPSPQQGTSPRPVDGTSLDPGRGHELDTGELHQEELDQRSDQSSPTSSRFAPSSGGENNEDDFDDPWTAPAQRQPSTAEKLTRKRADDRQLFLSLIDADRLRSDGTTFREGVFDTHLFYDGFRKLKVGDKKIGFPGAYLEPMYTAGADQGVWDWLLNLGVEPA